MKNPHHVTPTPPAATPSPDSDGTPSADPWEEAEALAARVDQVLEERDLLWRQLQAAEARIRELDIVVQELLRREEPASANRTPGAPPAAKWSTLVAEFRQVLASPFGAQWILTPGGHPEPVSPTAVGAVLASLAELAGPDGSNARPSQRLLAACTGLTRPTVARALAVAEREGWLTIEEKARGGRRWRAQGYPLAIHPARWRAYGRWADEGMPHDAERLEALRMWALEDLLEVEGAPADPRKTGSVGTLSEARR